MASPGIVDDAVSEETSAVTSHDVVGPPTAPTAGNLLVVIFAANAATAGTSLSGWTEMVDRTNGSAHLSAYWLKALGSEGASWPVTVVTVNSVLSAHVTYEIEDNEDPDTQAPELTSAEDTTTDPDPPANTPTGGLKDYLFIAAAAKSDDRRSPVSGFPANYTLGQREEWNGGASGMVAIAAAQQLTASTEDPGVFNYTGAGEDWVAATIAVHPPAVAAVYPPFPRRQLTTVRM